MSYSHPSLVTTDHFSRIFDFVGQHQWIYNFQLTNFFSEEVWTQAPAEWLSFLTNMSADELKELPYKACWDGCPDSLQHFLETCLDLSLPRNQTDTLEPTKLEPRFLQGLTAKKQHEVTYMSSYIHRLATKNSIQHVVDVGCGLGYLDHVLAHVYGYQILGIECSEAFAHKAEVRGSNLGQLLNNQNAGHLFTCALKLKESTESCQQFQLAVASYLTPIDKNKNDTVDSKQRFTNFPLSQAAQTALASASGGMSQKHLNIYAMRLAAQETRSRWFLQTAEEQNFHTKNVAFRGLLQILLEKHGIKPAKHGCRVTRKADFATADSYINAVLSKLQITSGKCFFLFFFVLKSYTQVQKLRTEFLSLCEQNRKYFGFIEPITSLQVLLQPVLESLIHLDRLAFLQEQGTKADLNSYSLSINDVDAHPLSLNYVDAHPLSINNVDTRPPSINDVDTRPPSINDVDTRPPSINDVDTRPPSINDVDTRPPSINDVDTRPLSINNVDAHTLSINDARPLFINDVDTHPLSINDVVALSLSINDVDTCPLFINNVDAHPLSINDVDTHSLSINDVVTHPLSINDVDARTLSINDVDTRTLYK
ncbi:unnamed protein product [Acanthosepion pharaonis]|uniref:Methyltransferase domain-containing protein n=1 Tax=Acanthosepion pharaonis TaxID=158019 RepID=A0A812D4J1_ACAPH|nr:unnamed protein product [Sepia pharaonis]